MNKIITLGFALAINAITCFSFGQGEVYLFGKLVPTSTSNKTEVIRIKAETPVVQFNSSTKSGFNNRAVLYNNRTKVQLSSVTNSNSYHRVSASISSGKVPTGSILKLAVQDPNNHFSGESNMNEQQVVLNKGEKTILSEIGTCYTGRAPGDGYGLEYSFVLPASNSKTKLHSENITVTLTISSEV